MYVYMCVVTQLLALLCATSRTTMPNLCDKIVVVRCFRGFGNDKRVTQVLALLCATSRTTMPKPV